MKQFLIIYGMPRDAMEKMSQSMSKEDMQKDMEDWKAWQVEHAESIPVPGNPAGKNTRVTADGAAEVPNEIAGYSIMEGESKEAVIEVVKTNPHFRVPGGYVEVMELMQM